MGFIPEKVVFVPIRLRNQMWDKYHFLARNCGNRRAKGREFIMPPHRTGFNEYMPQGQRTLTEVDGVVEIGLVGPATQKELWCQRRPTSHASVTPLRQQHSQQQPERRGAAARGPVTAAQGRSDRQPAATAAQQDGSSGQLPASCQHQYMLGTLLC
jgi:hypothetical protein